MMIVHVVAPRVEEEPAPADAAAAAATAAPAEPEVIKKGKIEKPEEEAKEAKEKKDNWELAIVDRRIRTAVNANSPCTISD